MPDYAVTIREQRTFVVVVKDAEDPDAARITALEQHLSKPGYPDTSHIDDEDCDVSPIVEKENQ